MRLKSHETKIWTMMNTFGGGNNKFHCLRNPELFSTEKNLLCSFHDLSSLPLEVINYITRCVVLPRTARTSARCALIRNLSL